MTEYTDVEIEIEDARAVCHAIANGFIPVACVEFKNLKQAVKMNNWKGTMYGLSIKETQRESNIGQVFQVFNEDVQL